MPTPYQTNYLDYNKIRCKSRNDCINKCNIKWALNHCNSLAPYTNLDINNDKDKYKETVLKYFDPDICESKYISPDCMNEYYEIKHIFKKNIKKK